MTDTARAKAVAHYAAARPDLEHQLAFFGKLWDAQDEIAERAAEYAPAASEDAARALKQHQTLFSLSEPQVPLDAFRDAVRTVAGILAEDGGLPEPQSEALREVDLGALVSEEALSQAFSGFDVFLQTVVEAAADDRLTEPLVSFVLSEALTPFVRAAAKSAMAAAGKFDWLQWDSGLCPVCGTPSSSGVVRDEGSLQGGRRWLSCPVCRAQWEYARVRCARCGTREFDELEYLFDEEDPAHRVHTCKKCHGYTPVTFEKDLRIIAIPEVEEIVLVRLEAIAAERGFTPLGDDAEGAAN